MEKRVLDRRLRQMEGEGVRFRANAHVGVDVDIRQLQGEFDALLLTGGACAPRDLPIPGRELAGIHFAMDYLKLQNRRCAGDEVSDTHFISAHSKRVVIIGGGDTGADCLGTAHRQGPLSVHQFEILPRPPEQRGPDNPWPQWPNIYRMSSAHEEGGERVYSVSTKRFIADDGGRLKALQVIRVELAREGGRMAFHEVAGPEFERPGELALLAVGVVGPEPRGGLAGRRGEPAPPGRAWRGDTWLA